jgi:trimeric autotransporter adhesin
VGADFSVTLGYNSIAEIHGVAIGNVAQSSGDGTVTIGNGAHNSAGDDSIAIGTLAGGSGIAHIALGHSAKATANYAIAVGSDTKSHSLNAICAGQGAYVSGPTDGADGDAQGGIAIGVNAKSLNTVADTGAGVAIGTGAYADNLSVALGRNALTNDSGIALGESASNGAFTHSIVIGQGDTNTANNQIIIGDNTYTDITIGGHAFPGAGGGTTDLTAPATGFTYTVPNGTASALINPAGTLATGTINMPAVPTDGQKLTIASSQQITALTMSGNGNTLLGALVTIGANGFATWQYRASNTTWFRVG